MSRQQDLLKALHRGLISRRDFVRAMGAIGVGAAAMPALMPGAAMASEPKKGGKITVGVEAAQAKDSLDPTSYFSTANILMGYSVYDGLVNRGPDLKPVPWLAESWEVGADPSEWIFELRKDVQWHDGKPFTADDVIYSCARHTREGTESPAKGYMSQIAEMTKDGDHVVRFKLSAPNADFPIVLSDTRVQISQNGYEDFVSTTVGTGPFKVKEWKSGSRYVFERNDDYWGSDGPWVDEIEVVGIGDITARVNALLSGDINVMLELDPKAVSLIERNKNVDLLRSQSGAFINLAMMLDREPTNNADFRLAMKHAVNREQIVKNVLKGYGSVGNDHPISPTDPYFCADIPQREYDPDKARFHIKKGGSREHARRFLCLRRTGRGHPRSLPGPAAVGGGGRYQPQSHQSARRHVLVSGVDSKAAHGFRMGHAAGAGSHVLDCLQERQRLERNQVRERALRQAVARSPLHGGLRQTQVDVLRNASDAARRRGHSTLAFRDILDAKAANVKGIAAHPSGPLGFYQFARTVWIDS